MHNCTYQVRVLMRKLLWERRGLMLSLLHGNPPPHAECASPAIRSLRDTSSAQLCPTAVSACCLRGALADWPRPGRGQRGRGRSRASSWLAWYHLPAAVAIVCGLWVNGRFGRTDGRGKPATTSAAEPPRVKTRVGPVLELWHDSDNGRNGDGTQSPCSCVSSVSCGWVN